MFNRLKVKINQNPTSINSRRNKLIDYSQLLPTKIVYYFPLVKQL